LDGAEHVPVVGHCQSGHAHLLGGAGNVVYSAGAVEKAELCVDVKMTEVYIRQRLKSS
jgi:hypothetical protein